MSRMVAKRALLVHHRGEITRFTHITEIHAEHDTLTIEGDTEDHYGLPHTVRDNFEIEDDMVLFVEFFIPKV